VAHESVKERESGSASPPASELPRSHSPTLSLSHSLRAWLYLVVLCLQRQRRNRQMVWMALGLLALTTLVVALSSATGWMDMKQWPWWIRYAPPTESIAETRTGYGPRNSKLQSYGQSQQPIYYRFVTYDEAVRQTELLPRLVPWPTPAVPIEDAIAASCRALLNRTGFMVFSKNFVFTVFLSFLLPIWSLSFATDAIGGEREARSLVWLLTRPLPRPAVYLAKFVAVLPWSLGLNLGGFGVLCLAAGEPGQMAFRLYWPAVFWATMAFCALFHLMGAWFRRSGIVGLVYCFFLETILGNMPGYMKRVSISFYSRCMMFDVAGDYGVQPEKPTVYLPVDGTTGMWVLVGFTIALLVLGMAVFSRLEYHAEN